MTRGKNRWTKSELPSFDDEDRYGPLICPCCGKPWVGPPRGVDDTPTDDNTVGADDATHD